MSQSHTLLFRIGGWIGALPVGHVGEILRPLPLERVHGLPKFVLGLSVVRGLAVPVVDVSLLLRECDLKDSHRWVVVRAEHRRLVLAVETVLGLRRINLGALEGMPLLLERTRPEYLESMGTLDSQIVVVLRTARILSEEAWQALSTQGMAS